MMPNLKPNLTTLGLAALVALAGCSQNPSVSPAALTQPAAPAVAPMPSDAQLGTPSGTVSMMAGPQQYGGGTFGLSGTGTLNFQGRRYSFNVAGTSARGFGSQVSPISGQVFNLTTVANFAGTYTVTAMSADRTSALLKNETGVSLRVAAPQPIDPGFQSLTIRVTG
jgi:hypothetical protein